MQTNTVSLSFAIQLVFALVLLGCGEDASRSDNPSGGGGGGGGGGAGGGDSGSGGCGQTASEAPGRVATTSGVVQGKRAGATWTWQGVPFAAPPVGALRFSPPADAACWEGVKETTAFGPACMLLDGAGAGIIGDEDCLTLNIWAPEAASMTSALPVLTFVHGGGHQQGSTSQQLPDGSYLYDGQRFVERSGAILVTVEYRLGPFGFLAHPALTSERPEKSGNYGMLDQIAALKWLKNNVARFGGDPRRIMVFGESAGAVSTCRIVASQLAAGLFSSAIIESGACVAKPLADAEQNGLRVAEQVGCGDASTAAACLRGVSAEALISTLEPLEATSLRQAYDGVIDGYALNDAPQTLIQTGQHNHVPVIIGSNTEELGRSAPAIQTEEQYRQAVQAYAAALGAPQLANALLLQYPASAYPSPRAAYVALTSDIKFTCSARKALRAFEQGQTEPTYRYVFSHVFDNASATVKALGATHGLELAFLFEALPNPGPGDEVVIQALNGYWSRLAEFGDPNGATATAWPEYDAASEPYLRLESPLETGNGYRATQCDFFDNLTRP